MYQTLSCHTLPNTPMTCADGGKSCNIRIPKLATLGLSVDLLTSQVVVLLTHKLFDTKRNQNSLRTHQLPTKTMKLLQIDLQAQPRLTSRQPQDACEIPVWPSFVPQQQQHIGRAAYTSLQLMFATALGSKHDSEAEGEARRLVSLQSSRECL